MKNLAGNRYERLTITSFDKKEKRKNHYRYFWNCQCDCGNIITSVNIDNLRSGHTRSCGCLNIEVVTERNTIHGYSKRDNRSTEHIIWTNMLDRCSNESSSHYSDYGGRGIKVCDTWKSSFMNFLLDMKFRPGKLYSLDRIDNDGDYKLDNCRWATKLEQANNKRNNIVILDTNTGIYYSFYELLNNLDISEYLLTKKLKTKTNLIKV
jgi:hypothetical protein